MKVYSPAVLGALAECLRTVHWYKRQFRSFLSRAGVPKATLGRLDWEQPKRFIAQELVDELAANPASGMAILERLIDAVVEIPSLFPHLARQEDGKTKVQEAQEAQEALKGLLSKETIVERAERARKERRTEAQRQADEVKARQKAVAKHNSRFMDLFKMADANQRGLDFQPLLRDIFALYDLDPRGSFANIGEQIDGSIRIDGTVLLVEAKWWKVPAPPKEVRDFVMKLEDKLDNTLGLMVSMAGFTDAAVGKTKRDGRILAILMDGQDLVRVFEGHVDLRLMLTEKLREASDRGNPLYRVP